MDALLVAASTEVGTPEGKSVGRLSRILASVLGLIAVAQFNSLAADSGPGGPSGQFAELFEVRDGARIERFRVVDPDAATSAAARDGAAWLGKDGSDSSALAGFVLTNHVLFRIVPGADLMSLQESHPDGVIAAVRSAPGFHTLRFATVRRAIAAAALLANDARVADVSIDLVRPTAPRTVPPDPNFPEQWHLKNTVTPIADVNAEAAWDAGFTGTGIVIGIADYGVQTTHPDLVPNRNVAGSQAGVPIDPHGTSAAGVAAATAYNFYGCGVAYGSQWSAQYIGGPDTGQADAEAFANDINHIKSNSWGPVDFGYIVPVPAVVGAAISDGVATGRGGLGEIFVWAGGNGAVVKDRTDYDGYANNRRVIAIGAVGDLDTHSPTSEPGACLLAVAHSDGNVRKIATITSGSSWTTSFGGTSSACPLAAGAIALMLQANPLLTWRDVQHVLVNAARICDPNDPGWVYNAAGHRVNHNYGFGAVDAYALATAAASWQNVPHEISFDTGPVSVGLPIPDNNATGVTKSVVINKNMRIEAVELVLNVTHTFVGDLDIRMIAPSGTESVFATVRDDPTDNYTNFVYDSKRLWDELSAGTWTVKISDQAAADVGTWQNFSIRVYGTPRCAGNLNDDGLIDLTDLAELLTAYGACEGDANFLPEADINNDKCVELTDLAYLLSVYGNICP